MGAGLPEFKEGDQNTSQQERVGSVNDGWCSWSAFRAILNYASMSYNVCSSGLR